MKLIPYPYIIINDLCEILCFTTPVKVISRTFCNYLNVQVRQEIQKAKLELTLELQRSPTDEEIIARAGITPERYHDVMKASKPVLSLNAKHLTTQEEFINGITDIDGAGGDDRRQPALLRLALDDVVSLFLNITIIFDKLSSSRSSTTTSRT